METKLEGIWESQCLTACYLGMNYVKLGLITLRVTLNKINVQLFIDIFG